MFIFRLIPADDLDLDLDLDLLDEDWIPVSFSLILKKKIILSWDEQKSAHLCELSIVLYDYDYESASCW